MSKTMIRLFFHPFKITLLLFQKLNNVVNIKNNVDDNSDNDADDLHNEHFFSNNIFFHLHFFPIIHVFPTNNFSIQSIFYLNLNAFFQKNQPNYVIIFSSTRLIEPAID